MRFAILGDHPDGWAIARALAASGRHQIYASFGPRPEAGLKAEWPRITRFDDLEELLADPAVEAVIVAGKPGDRLDRLRRVLQSERSGFCVHPVGSKPDGAYEINMLQGDTHQVVVPLLPLAVNRTVADLLAMVEEHGPPRLIEIDFRAPGEPLFDDDETSGRPHFPGWEILRRLGGTVAEVQAFAREETVRLGEPVTVQGRFEGGGLFRAAYFPGQPDVQIRVTIHQSNGEMKAVTIETSDADWRLLVERFETALARLRGTPRAVPGSGPAADAGQPPTWHDEIRAAELDDAARRGIERRRAVTLEYQTVNEEVAFKGTMTLIGCGLIWAIPVLLFLSIWFPYAGWLIIPVLFGFLLLQLLRWFVPMPPGASKPNGGGD